MKIEKGRVPKEIFDLHVPAHVEYVKSLRKNGRYAQSGYWAGGGGGMMLFEAGSEEEARRLIAEDPLVKNELVTYELREWRMVLPGKISI